MSSQAFADHNADPRAETLPPGQLLAVLERIESGPLPGLLARADQWQSLFVDYEPPFVERLWAPVSVDGAAYRVFLHRIHPADPERCLFHPHPWPSAIKILSGSYWMNAGHGAGFEPPPVSMRLKLVAGASYEMAHPDGWHSVCPLGEPSRSIMVTGAPWSRPSHKPTKQLLPLDPAAADALLGFFRRAYGVSVAS
jgi:hypothetical protein